MTTKLQEVFRTLGNQDQKRNSPQHIITKHKMHRVKEGLLRAAREENTARNKNKTKQTKQAYQTQYLGFFFFFFEWGF